MGPPNSFLNQTYCHSEEKNQRKAYFCFDGFYFSLIIIRINYIFYQLSFSSLFVIFHDSLLINLLVCKNTFNSNSLLEGHWVVDFEGLHF